MGKSHMEGFELAEECFHIWEEIRFKRISEIQNLTDNVIAIFDKHQDGEFLVSEDYTTVCELFRRMKMRSMFHMASDVKELIYITNPKLKEAFVRKECIRKLKYIGVSNDNLTNGKIYKSINFNGVTYTLNKDNKGEQRSISCLCFERID